VLSLIRFLVRRLRRLTIIVIKKMFPLIMFLVRRFRKLTIKRDTWRERIRVGYYSYVCGSVGKNTRFAEGIIFHHPESLFIGDNVGINRGTWINAYGRVQIGDNVIIGPNVIIHSANHNFDRLDIPIRLQGWTTAPVIIEEDVWIAASAIILPGIRIGKGSVIAAGAVVTGDIPPYSIAMGVPAVVIRNRKQTREDIQ